MRDVRDFAVAGFLLLSSFNSLIASDAGLGGPETPLGARPAHSLPTTVMRLHPAPESTVDTSGNNVIATTGTSDSNSAFIVRNSGANEVFRVRADGKVGIGTSDPVMNLHVVGQYAEVEFIDPSQSPATLFLAHAHGSLSSRTNLGATDFAGSFLFGAYIGTGYANAGRIDSYVTAANSQGVTSDLIFSAANVNGGNFELMRLTGTGNVGIGVALPTHKFEVNGDASFTGAVTGGNIQAKYQDLAEWVPATQQLQPGTVVVLCAEKKVTSSTVAYDTKVAGVVSAQPGIILGEGGPDRVKVATTGRVRVRVDATQHPIAVGDLLFSSDVSGAAMYSTPIDVAGVKIHRPGTLIGKALEPLDHGRGEVLVLLSLQ